MPTFYVDYDNGNDNYAGTSFNVLASGVDGALAAGASTVFGTFTSASSTFPNDGTISPTKNLAWYSNCLNFNSAALGASLYKDSTIGPSSIDAFVYKIVEDISSNNTHYWQSTTWYNLWTASTNTVSVYAKAAEKNKVILRFDNDTKTARFNLSNGTVEASGAGVTATSIVDAGNGWYRISMTATVTNALSDNLQIILIPNNNTGLTYAAYDGDGNSGIYICGLQIEAGSSVTSYEKPPEQYLNIWMGSSYSVYHIVQRIDANNLKVIITPTAGSPVSSQSSRQFYIGGRWKTLTNGATSTRIATDDTVRIMSSPDPTSIGSGTWVGSKTQATVAISSSTNASPIVITTSSTMSSLGISNGDTITITGHTTNTNANGTWEVSNVSGSTCSLVGSSGNGIGGATGVLRKASNQRVLLSSSPIINIASHGNRGNGRTAWTAQTADITTSLNTSDFKEGDCSDSIVVGTNFTTGLAAYKATGSLNLSGYQQLSFWIKQTAGTVGASGALSLVLCSDTAGATPVNTFNIENLTVINRWVPITIDLSTNLGSNIQSIAFYVNTDNGTQTFLLSNIIACKASSSADSLNLCSLIGKNIAGETWCGIQSINGTRVMLDNTVQVGPVSAGTTTITVPGYYGTSETITTHKRETIKVPMASASTTVNVSLVNMQRGGTTPLTPITFTFGWNRTNMNSRTGETWFDGRNGFGYLSYNYYLSGGNLKIDRLCGVRFSYGLFLPGCSYSTITNCHFNNNDISGLYLREVRNVTSDTIYNCFNNNNGLYVFSNVGQCSMNNTINNSNNGYGVLYYNTVGFNSLTNFTIKNNINGILLTGGYNLTATSGTISDTTAYALRNESLGSNNIFKNTNFSTNTSASVRCNAGGPLYLINCLLNDTTQVENTASAGYAQDCKVYSHNHNQTTNNHNIFCELGLIYSTATVRYSNNGLAWAMAPTSTSRNIYWPLDLKIATVAVNANSLVTVKAWMRRTSIALNFRLRVKGGQIAGVTNDVVSYMTAAADTWEQVTLSFTPTESGVVEILAECWGGSTFTGFIDDISITQV